MGGCHGQRLAVYGAAGVDGVHAAGIRSAAVAVEMGGGCGGVYPPGGIGGLQHAESETHARAGVRIFSHGAARNGGGVWGGRDAEGDAEFETG